MPIEPVKIPQNVYVEDRIIGPITLKQLLIVGIGTGISYAVYAMATKSGPVGIPLTVILWTPALVAAAFAFVKVNDLSLFQVILLAIEHMNKPNQRTWIPHSGLSINIITSSTVQAIEQANTKIAANASKLAEVTRQMKKREEELDKLASHSIDTVTAVETEPASPPVAVAEKTVPNETKTLPVNRSKVRAQGLDPERAVDGISNTLSAYQDVFKK